MKTRRVVLYAFAVLLCLGVVGLARWLRPYDLDAERAAARSAGIPLSDAEFPQPAPPPEEDALPVYDQLTALLKATPLDFRAAEPNTRESTNAVPRVKTAELRALIAGRPDVTSLVRQAAAKPHAYLKIMWTPDQLFPQMATMREAAKWIRWESELLARDGKYKDAVKNEGLAFRVANQASEQPTVISHLVSHAIEAIAMQGFKDILHEAGDKPEVAEAVQREIAAYKSNRDLTRCLEGEMMMGVTILHGINSLHDLRGLLYQSSGDESWNPSIYTPHSITRSLFLNPSEAVYIHWMGRYVAASRGPILQRNAAMAKVQRDFNAAPKMEPTYAFTTMMMPVFGRVGERDVQALARRASQPRQRFWHIECAPANIRPRCRAPSRPCLRTPTPASHWATGARARDSRSGLHPTSPALSPGTPSSNGKT
jgi:hypothetical protein